MYVAPLFCLALPLLLLWAEPRSRWVRRLGPVILCYAAGLGVALVPFWRVPVEAVETTGNIGAILSIPLVLFSADFVAWRKLAGSAFLAFACSALGVCVMATLAYVLFADTFPDAAALAAMGVGVYTGGTPNLNAIGLALEVDATRIAQANLTDLLVSLPILLLGFTIAGKMLRGFLPAYPQGDPVTTADASRPARPKSYALGILLAALCVGAAVGLNEMLPTSSAAIVVVGATLAGIGLSFLPRVRALPGTYQLGTYFLLVFCVAIGMQLQLDRLVSQALPLVGFFAILVYGTLGGYLLLVRLFRIDADTALVVLVAALFSPVFVPPIARVLGNRRVVATGMAVGVIGFAAGTLLGLAVYGMLV